MKYWESKPKVSVIVPIYNQERYLEISIPSILGQTYSNIEVVLVNDGSTDTSLSIMEKYKKIDNRIKIFEKTNGGLVDATIFGIKNATGDYVCFLDPDDKLGKNFILFFLENIKEEEDFIAAGFCYDNGKEVIPYYLQEDKEYSEDEIEYYRGSFLLDKSTCNISNRFFVSRWNKMYKMSCIQGIVEEFSECKGVSLGEDTIFTFLMLCNSKKGRTVSKPNSYYYNIGNQNSMMQSKNSSLYLEKCKKANYIFGMLLKNHNQGVTQANQLYYLLSERIFSVDNENRDIFMDVYAQLRSDGQYIQAIKHIAKDTSSLRKTVELLCRISISSAKLYLFINRECFNNIKKQKLILSDIKYGMKSITQKGICQGIYSYIFRKRRRNAYKEIVEMLPVIEKRISGYLELYLDKISDLNECTIENNIFVFWWDGFEQAPLIVKKCYESIQKHHQNYKVIGIDKNNYLQYTNIHPIILNDFKKGKISVQTFSDILRFNLLNKNGGTWIDSTIFFAREFELQKGLETKPFDSLEFSTSGDFLQYKNINASWSGFYISSRKNSVITKAINDVFEKYYLEYKTYSTYFFIDAVLMICKLKKIDGGVLDNTLSKQGDMFALSKVLDKEYFEEYISYIEQVPQKLSWMIGVDDRKRNTFLSKVVFKDNEGDYNE